MTEPTKPTAPTDYTFGTTTFTDSSGTANDGIVTITKGTTSTAVEVTVNNVLNSTAGDNILKLAKELTGGPAGYTGPFRINYDCTGTAFDGHVDVTAGTFQTVSGFPTGTVCTITETLPNPAPNGYSFGTPTFTETSGTADDGVVTILGSATVTVTTHNTLTRNTGSLKVAKTLTGGPATGYDPDYTISWNCDDGDGAPYDGSTTVKAGAAAVTARSGIPTGTQCTVSETLPNPPTGWSFSTPTYDPSATVTIATKDQVVTVTVHNTLAVTPVR